MIRLGMQAFLKSSASFPFVLGGTGEGRMPVPDQSSCVPELKIDTHSGDAVGAPQIGAAPAFGRRGGAAGNAAAVTRRFRTIREAASARLRRVGINAIHVTAAMFALAGCGSDSSNNDPYGDINFDNVNPIVYSQHIQRVFTTSCNTAACHNSVDQAAGLLLTSYEETARGSTFGTQVVPFRPDRSHLYLHMTGELEPLMPLALEPMRDDIVRLIKRWIEAGAPNDNGSLMYSNVTRKVFVACQGENLVAVLDLDTGLLVRLIAVDQPHSVYVDAANHRLYVTRFETASDNIQVFDTTTLQKITSGQAGTFPALLGIAPGSSELWVTNFDTGSQGADHRVRVLDPVSLAELSSFNLPISQPHGLAFSPDGSRVYISNIGTSDISIFSTNPPDVVEGSIHLPGGEGQQPQQCVISPDGSRLYVSALGTDQVHVLNTQTLTWGTSVTVGDAPWHLTYIPSTNELWVANWIGESVSILSLADPDAPVQIQELKPVHPKDPERNAFERPIGISLLPGTNIVYVASANDDGSGQGHHPPPDGQKNPGSVTSVNVTNRAVLRVEEVPNFARFLAFLP